MTHDITWHVTLDVTLDTHVTRRVIAISQVIAIFHVIAISHETWYLYHKKIVAYHMSCHTDVTRQTCGIWRDACLSSVAYHKTCVVSYYCHTQHVSFVAHIVGANSRCLSTLSFPHLCTTWIGPSSVRVIAWCLRGNTAATALWPCVHFEGSLVQKERADKRDTSWLDGVRLEAVRQCWDRSLVLYLLAPVHKGYKCIRVCVCIRTHTHTHTHILDVVYLDVKLGVGMRHLESPEECRLTRARCTNTPYMYTKYICICICSAAA